MFRDNNEYLEDEGMDYYGKIIRKTGKQNCIVHYFTFGIKKKKKKEITKLNGIIEGINHQGRFRLDIRKKSLHWKSG